MQEAKGAGITDKIQKRVHRQEQSNLRLEEKFHYTRFVDELVKNDQSRDNLVYNFFCSKQIQKIRKHILTSSYTTELWPKR